MVSWKFFFIDDPVWPTPPAGVVPIGSLALMGVGRMFLLCLLGKEILQWILSLIS